MQRFATPQWVLLCFSTAAFIQGMLISGYVNVSLPTLERRFNLRSFESGMIVTFFNVGSLILMAPVTFFGGEMHKPRLMAIGAACMGVGSFIFSIPHFIAPQYRFSVEAIDLCPHSATAENTADSEQHTEALRMYRFVFMFANLIHGSSTIPFYTLSVAYLDDNLSASMSPRYIGIYHMASILGPAFGFISGGMLLNIYTDISVDPKSIGLTPSSNVWIGAWWIGFIIAGCLALLVSLPIFGFPKALPGAAALQAQKPIEVHRRSLSAEADHEIEPKLSHMPRAVCDLVRNPTFLFMSLAATLETMIGSGYSNFGTKLFESQFGMTAAAAATLIGMIAVPSASLGCVLGGYVVSKLQLSCANTIRFCVAVSLFTWFAFLSLLVSCPDMKFEGIDIQNKLVFAPNCSLECSCPQTFNPVCGRDGKMYVSPCLAGCRYATKSAEAVEVYSNCDCIPVAPINSSEFLIAAERVRCTQDCPAYYLYLLGTFLCLFCTFFISAPGISVTIRCVTVKQKAFALGIQWAFIRLLGTIPAPLIFGKTVDLACEIWSTTFGGQSNEGGHCVLYSNATLGGYMSGLLLLLKGLSVVLFICASLTYKTPGGDTHRVSTSCVPSRKSSTHK
ncbi:solute carrier organic anion transporter family member 4A1-like isoform X1 [Haemaphysalis longicornis]